MFSKSLIFLSALATLAMAMPTKRAVGRSVTLKLPANADVSTFCTHVWGPDCTNTVPDPTSIGYVDILPDSAFCDIDEAAGTFDARCYFGKGSGIYENIDTAIAYGTLEVVSDPAA